MSLLDTIAIAQRNAGEAAVIANLERMGLGALWAVHVQGPDDIIPAPTHAEAEAACVLLNAAWARIPKQGEEHVWPRAAVVQWPHSRDAHEKARHEFRQLLGSELQVAW